MKEIIKKRGKNLIIKLTIPLKTEKIPYMDPEDVKGTGSIAGKVARKFNRCGFAYKIGRKNCISDCFYLFNGGIEEFEKLCKKLEIDIIED